MERVLWAKQFRYAYLIETSVSQGKPSAVTNRPQSSGAYTVWSISHSCQSQAQLRDLAHDVVQGPSSFPFMVLPSSRASSRSPGFSVGAFGARPGSGKHHRPFSQHQATGVAHPTAGEAGKCRLSCMPKLKLKPPRSIKPLLHLHSSPFHRWRN